MPSGPEWIVVLIVVLLIFGGTQLPKMARNLGRAQKDFKEGLAEAQASTMKPDSPPSEVGLAKPPAESSTD